MPEDVVKLDAADRLEEYIRSFENRYGNVPVAYAEPELPSLSKAVPGPEPVCVDTLAERCQSLGQPSDRKPDLDQTSDTASSVPPQISSNNQEDTSKLSKSWGLDDSSSAAVAAALSEYRSGLALGAVQRPAPTWVQLPENSRSGVEEPCSAKPCKVRPAQRNRPWEDRPRKPSRSVPQGLAPSEDSASMMSSSCRSASDSPASSSSSSSASKRLRRRQARQQRAPSNLDRLPLQSLDEGKRLRCGPAASQYWKQLEEPSPNFAPVPADVPALPRQLSSAAYFGERRESHRQQELGGHVQIGGVCQMPQTCSPHDSAEHVHVRLQRQSHGEEQQAAREFLQGRTEPGIAEQLQCTGREPVARTSPGEHAGSFGVTFGGGQAAAFEVSSILHPARHDVDGLHSRSRDDCMPPHAGAHGCFANVFSHTIPGIHPTLCGSLGQESMLPGPVPQLGCTGQYQHLQEPYHRAPASIVSSMLPVTAQRQLLPNSSQDLSFAQESTNSVMQRHMQPSRDNISSVHGLDSSSGSASAIRSHAPAAKVERHQRPSNPPELQLRVVGGHMPTAPRRSQPISLKTRAGSLDPLPAPRRSEGGGATAAIAAAAAASAAAAGRSEGRRSGSCRPKCAGPAAGRAPALGRGGATHVLTAQCKPSLATLVHPVPLVKDPMPPPQPQPLPAENLEPTCYVFDSGVQAAVHPAPQVIDPIPQPQPLPAESLEPTCDTGVQTMCVCDCSVQTDGCRLEQRLDQSDEVRCQSPAPASSSTLTSRPYLAAAGSLSSRHHLHSVPATLPVDQSTRVFEMAVQTDGPGLVKSESPRASLQQGEPDTTAVAAAGVLETVVQRGGPCSDVVEPTRASSKQEERSTGATAKTPSQVLAPFSDEPSAIFPLHSPGVGSCQHSSSGASASAQLHAVPSVGAGPLPPKVQPQCVAAAPDTDSSARRSCSWSQPIASVLYCTENDSTSEEDEEEEPVPVAAPSRSRAAWAAEAALPARPTLSVPHQPPAWSQQSCQRLAPLEVPARGSSSSSPPGNDEDAKANYVSDAARPTHSLPHQPPAWSQLSHQRPVPLEIPAVGSRNSSPPGNDQDAKANYVSDAARLTLSAAQQPPARSQPSHQNPAPLEMPARGSRSSSPPENCEDALPARPTFFVPHWPPARHCQRQAPSEVPARGTRSLSPPGNGEDAKANYISDAEASERERLSDQLCSALSRGLDHLHRLQLLAAH